MNSKKITAGLLAMVIAAGIGNYHVNNYAYATSVYKDIIFENTEVNGGEVIKGVDISSVISLEKSGVVYRDEKGNPQDIFLTLKNAGVNYIRVRVWNNPNDSNGNTYGGGANDINTAVEIAKRCSKYGLKMLVDFHYSDFWADPGKQNAPKEWKYYSADQKCSAVKEFTAECLRKMSSTGVEIGMVQIGNETNSGLCGETDWKNICSIMNAGASAVRNYDRKILIAVHFTNPEKSGNLDYLAGNLKTYNVDYDVFATSYYPYWHGTISNLTAVLSQIASKYNKYVMVAETSWANTFEDSDCFGNTISSKDSLGNYVNYDISVQGQINEISDVFNAVAAVGPKGIGAFYWEPAWLTVGDEYSHNLSLWEKEGSGWASRAAAEYDAEAETYYGGSSVDNQALFSQDGRPLESLYVFSHITSEKTSGENIISNPGFESGSTGWKLENTTSGEYSKFEINGEMIRTGESSVHWYSPNAFEYSGIYTEYTAKQTGYYRFSSWLAGERTTYKVLVSINGEHKESESGTLHAYDVWENPSAEFYAETGDTIGLWIEVNGETESYGSVDDCRLVYLYESGPQPSRDPSAEPTGNSHVNPDPVPTEAPSGQPAEIKIKGDVITDGTVNVSDLIHMKDYLVSDENTGFICNKDNADMNDDGRINIVDFILLKNLILSY